MTREFLYLFIRQHRLAVLATTATGRQHAKTPHPEAAVIGFAVTKDFEIVFDTDKTSRKYANLIAHPHTALVIGWDNETTVQYEGVARELAATEGDAYKEVYYSVYPDGRERAKSWPNLTHFVIQPTWIRYSNFNDPPAIHEITF